jgi:hypothetical protein
MDKIKRIKKTDMRDRAGEEAPGSLASAPGNTGALEGRGDTPNFQPGETAADRNKKPVGRRPHQGHMKPED